MFRCTLFVQRSQVHSLPPKAVRCRELPVQHWLSYTEQRIESNVRTNGPYVGRILLSRRWISAWPMGDFLDRLPSESRNVTRHESLYRSWRGQRCHNGYIYRIGLVDFETRKKAGKTRKVMYQQFASPRLYKGRCNQKRLIHKTKLINSYPPIDLAPGNSESSRLCNKISNRNTRHGIARSNVLIFFRHQTRNLKYQMSQCILQIFSAEFTPHHELCTYGRSLSKAFNSLGVGDLIPLSSSDSILASPI